jgi:deoxyribonuclease-2
MNKLPNKTLYLTTLFLILINSTITVKFLSDKEVELDTKKQDISSCLSPDGKSVDWYFIFLMNKDYNKFVYMDNTMKDSKIYDLTKEDFPPLKLALSLNSGENNYIVWNDEPISTPEKSFSKIAHSKGILSYNSDNGVYLVHSLPKFPSMTESKKSDTFNNEFPNNEGSYAQTFMCATYDHKNLIKIAEALRDIRIGVQSINHSNSYNKDLDRLLKDFDNINNVKDAEINVQSITTLAGSEMNFFTKPKSVLELPWDNHIPAFYKEDFYVGTWTRPQLLPPVCKKYKTLNIIKYSVKDMTYNNTQDHSKWGHSKKVFCVGDLNRTSSQLNRSGSVTCLKSALVSGIVEKFAEETDSC